VLIDVRAAGISYPDLLLSRGEYQLRQEPPFTLGQECAGIVVAAPEGSGLAAGDRVCAAALGCYAEQVATPAAATFPLHRALSFEQGAALVMNYHTAHFALEHRARLVPGEVLLVQGAAGGVGTAAIQVGKGLGARVIGVVSTEDKERVARQAGADEVVRSDSDWRQAVADLTGGGADVIYDPVGGERFDESVRALATDGRLVVIGFVEGEIPKVAVNRLLFRNVSVVGAGWGHYAFGRPDYLRSVAAALDEMVDAGVVDPVVGATYALDEVPQALRDLDERRAVGKLVLEVSG
jgi:NADPH2:quinone reductase